MKTSEYIIEKYNSRTIDGGNINRLMPFLTVDQVLKLGFRFMFKSKEDQNNHIPIQWTRENILEQLKEDVAFGFNKALNQWSTANTMFSVVQMWNWILEEGLEDWSDHDYAYYGLPLFRATAVKYNFDNPIGEDTGTEEKYSD